MGGHFDSLRRKDMNSGASHGFHLPTKVLISYSDPMLGMSSPVKVFQSSSIRPILASTSAIMSAAVRHLEYMHSMRLRS